MMPHRTAVIALAMAAALTTACAANALSATTSRSQKPSPRPEAPPDVNGPGHVLRAGNLWMKVTNWGVAGNPYTNLSSDPSAQWPGASGVEYLNSISLAVGAVDPVGTPTRRVSYLNEWAPPSLDAVDRIYDTASGAIGGAADINDDGDYAFGPGDPQPRIDEDFLDGRDNDGDAVIDEDFAAHGQQMFSLVMRDDGPQSTANGGETHVPFPLECRQRAWAYSVSGYRNFDVLEYTIINHSGHPLDSLVVGWRVDGDVGPFNVATFFNDDRDLPRFPSGDFVRVLDPSNPQRQFPHDPSLNSDVSPDSALCPRTTLRINGFSFADNDGDGGATAGVATFLLLGHTIDPLGMSAPSRVGFHSFRRFLAGVPYGAGGNPGTDAERFELMSQGEGVDPGTKFISVAPSGTTGDQVAWCSIGPFRNVPNGGSVQATVAYMVTDGDYASAAQYETDYAAFQAGSLGGAQLITGYPALEAAIAAQVLYEGDYHTSFGQPVPDFHGRETALRAPLGGPPFFAEDCRGEGNPRLVSDLAYTWFDFDCDYCTGVWAANTHTGYFQRHWAPEPDPASVEPPPAVDPEVALRLSAPAPNPTAGGSTVAFTLMRAGRARIEIRDVAGRLIRMLKDDALIAGTHSVTWDGTDARGRATPPGVYLWRVEANGAAATAKMLRMH